MLIRIYILFLCAVFGFLGQMIKGASAAASPESKVAALPVAHTGAAVPTSGMARVYPDTELVKDGKPAAVIVYSGTDAATADAAKQLGAALKSRLGVEFPAVADTTLCSNIMTRVPEEYRNQNLIVVGNLNNNRVVFPLYVVFLCGADCEFPGDAGYELRTISNPWGTGKNVLLIGGSTPAGVHAGVAALLANLPSAAAANLTIKRLHEIKPGKAVKAKFDAIAARLPKAQFKRPPQPCEAAPYMFSGPAMQYHWTGDPRWAAIAREAINYFNEIYTGCYLADGEHYTAEAFFRAWDLIEESPVFSDAERQATIRRMLETSWRWNGGVASGGGGGGVGHIGNTHGTMIVMSKWTATRYLQRTFRDEPELLKKIAGGEANIRNYYKTAFGGFLDDGHGIASFGSFVRWSAMEQEPAYFESGYARQGLLYVATYYDPLGYMAGIGMYGEARSGAMRSRQSYWCEAYLFRLAAFICRDPELALLGNRFSEYGPVDVWPVMNLSAYGAGTYPLPPEVKTKPPALADGLSIVPFDQRRYRLWNIGAPTRGVPLNQRMPILERMFDKICFRSGYDRQDQYLLLQGLFPDTEDANTIARYTDQGQIWLAHNSGQAGPFVRNGIFVSDGLNDRKVQSGCRLDAAGRFEDLGMISSTLLDFYESDWQRAVFWKPKGWFVVIDRAILARAGQYAAQSIWRLPSIPGVWNAGKRTLTVMQNGKKFCIQAGENLPASARFESPEGGMPDIYENPFILRQYKSGFYAAQRVLDFQNILTVTDAANSSECALSRINDSAALVQGPAGDVCVVAVGGPGTGVFGLDADGGIYAITPREIYLAGVRMLRLDGEMILDAPSPVSVRIDLKTGAISAGYDQAELREAASTWKMKKPGVPVSSWPAEKAQEIARTLAERQLAVAGGKKPLDGSGLAGAVAPSRTNTDETAPLSLVWESADAGFYGKPLAGLEVKKADDAERGVSDALVNRIIPGRDEGMFWPGTKAEVELGWLHPESIGEIRIHSGRASREVQSAQRMSADRAIELEWSSDGFKNDVRQQTLVVDREIRIDPTYKGEVTACQYLCVPCDGISASGVRLTIPRSTNDIWSGIGISEIEVLTTNRGPLNVEQLLVADLGSKSEPSIIMSTEEMRLVVFGPDGKQRWQKTFTGRVPSIVVADINGDGKKEIVCCSYDMNVYALAADGRELWKTSCVDLFKKTGGKTGLNGSTPFAVGFWEPRPGLRRIAVGQYASKSVLLDENGKIMDFAGVSGYTARNFFGQMDLNGDGLDELCLSSILYKGSGNINVHIVDRDGKPVDKTGGAVVPGGAPFVAQLLKDKPGYAAIIAPAGAGVYNLNLAEGKRGGFNALWESCNRPLSAGCLHDVDGNGADELLVGGRDGFVTVYSTDGIPLRVVLIGEDAKGILAFGAGEALRYVVATPNGLRVYDGNWKLLGVHPGEYARLNLFDPARRAFIAVTDDARIQMWTLEKTAGR